MSRIILVLAVAMPLTAAQAHEAWLEPQEFGLNRGDTLKADFRVGENFKGFAQPFIPNWFERFELHDRRGMRSLKGAAGDKPAAQIKLRAKGLNRLVYFSNPKTLRFRKWDKFVSYANNEGFPERVQQHVEKGLPQTGFVEAYRRCAKLLLKVGKTKADSEPKPVGLPLELMVVKGLRDANTPLVVRLLQDGEPVAGRQVRVFKKSDQPLVEELMTTNQKGEISLQAAKGTELMLSSVHLFESEKEGALYASNWANLVLQR